VPISCTQERIWLARQLRLVRRASYEPATQIGLQGRLNSSVLSWAVDEIRARHESLRTRFQIDAGVPHQIIDAPGGEPLPLIGLSELNEESKRNELHRLLDHEAREGFDLTRGPLLRMKLIRFCESEHLLLLKVNHLVFDGWSLGVLFRELGALYTAAVRGQDRRPLAELPLQYADYAVWQRQLLQGSFLDEQLQYWRKRLAGLRPLNLPTTRPRPQTRSFRGDRVPISISGSLTTRLRALGRSECATLYMVLLGALQLLLSRWSGQTDIAVGSVVAGRVRRETELLIGFFLNIVVIRVDVAGTRCFRDLLARVREATLEAFTHQYVPFERLVIELAAAGDDSRHPLFQVLFVLQNFPYSRLELPGIETSLSIGARRLTRYDLMVELWEGPDGLSGHIGYNTELFDAATIGLLRTELLSLLESLPG